jgi:sec-independent protein translocase protein TatB
VFNLSGSEIVFILLAALVLLGPEKLPETLRKVGRVYAEVRKISNGFQSELRSVIDEPTKEIRNAFEEPAKEIRNTAEQAKSAFSLQQLNPNGKPTTSATPASATPPVVADATPPEPVTDAFGALPTASEPSAAPAVPAADADEATA